MGYVVCRSRVDRLACRFVLAHQPDPDVFPGRHLAAGSLRLSDPAISALPASTRAITGSQTLLGLRVRQRTPISGGGPRPAPWRCRLPQNGQLHTVAIQPPSPSNQVTTHGTTGGMSVVLGVVRSPVMAHPSSPAGQRSWGYDVPVLAQGPDLALSLCPPAVRPGRRLRGTDRHVAAPDRRH